jgi:hypothetical protein
VWNLICWYTTFAFNGPLRCCTWPAHLFCPDSPALPNAYCAFNCPPLYNADE